MAFVYILYSEKKNRYYVGSTPDITRRLDEHNRGHSLATKYGIPWTLAFSCHFPLLSEARRLEYRIKRLKDRRVIKQIIREQLVRLTS